MTMAQGDPETILVYVGLDLIGDGLIKLPFVRALRNAFPAARITWLAGKGPSVYAGALAPLVAGLIDEVIETARIGGSWFDVLSRPLPGRRFDLILDTQRRVGTTLALRRVRHGRFISGAARHLLSDVRPAGAPGPAYRKPEAMIDQMLELVALASAGRADAALDVGGRVSLPDAIGEEAARLLPAGPRYVGLAPGAGDRAKCWPLESFIALGRRLADRAVTPVFLLGPDEADWAKRLLDEVPGARCPLSEPGVRVDLEPLLTIGIAARCGACVANDSGGGHLMAASGSRLVSLFGPTPASKFAPRAPGLTVIEAQAYGSRDMAAIPVEAVEAALLSPLGAR